MDQSKIAARVAARQSAQQVVDLIAGEIKDFTDDQVESFWAIIQAIAPPQEPTPAAEPEIVPMNDEESFGFGQRTMQFGKHQGERIDSVPIEYVVWLAESADTFKTDLKRYLMSRRVQAEQETPEEDHEQDR